MQDVHVYDGKLIGKFTPIHIFDNDNKTSLFARLISILDDPVSKNMVQLILDGINNTSNYDSTNMIDASDVLVDILMFDDGVDGVLKTLEQQLIDMYQLGSCPQGRVVRLLQIWKAIQQDVSN